MRFTSSIGILLGFVLTILWSGLPTAVLAQNRPFDEGTSVGAPVKTTTVPGVAAAPVEPVFEVDVSWANVRTGPGTNYGVVKCLPRGTKGKKLEERNGWYKIQFENGVTGWIRGDLVGQTGGSPTPPIDPTAADKAWVEKEMARWQRHLGDSTLNFDRYPYLWTISRAWRKFKKGDYNGAYLEAADDVGNPTAAGFLKAMCLYKLGLHAEAKYLLTGLQKRLEDQVLLKYVDAAAQPYIDEKVVFKFGGFDTVNEYKTKAKAGNRLGLESSEYYEDFVDINTWTWKSAAKAKEFTQIGGIDCSGFVQRVEQGVFSAAGVSYPIPGRTSTSGLWSKNYTKEVNPGFRPPPPPDIRPGDMLLFDYGHNRYGHSMIYRGTDALGNIHVVMMGDYPEQCIIPPEKYQYYKGAYRMNGMDKVRGALTA